MDGRTLMIEREQTIELLERVAEDAWAFAELLRETDFEEPEELPPAPLDFRCPMCGAPPGQQCRTRRGDLGDSHLDRAMLAGGGEEPQPCACRQGGWQCYLHDPLRIWVARRHRWVKK